jgi:hypothetical protein
MLQNISFPSNIQSTIGKYDVIKTTFQSDVMIIGKVLNVNIALWGDAFTPNSAIDGYYLMLSGGSTKMTPALPNVWHNYEVWANVIDSKTVEVELRYLNTADLDGFLGDVAVPNLSNWHERSYSLTNSVYDIGKRAIIEAKIENEVTTGYIDQENNYWCETDFRFTTTTFNPNEDLVIEFESNDLISQSYFAGFYREDTINSYQNVVQSIGLNYAEINGGVNVVDDIPNNCIISGNNTINIGGISKGSFKIDKSCLTQSGVYRAYVVYKHLGQWHSCRSERLTASAGDKPIIVPEIGYLSTDSDGTTYIDGCLKNVPQMGIIEMCAIIDIADMNAKIAANGYSGTFDMYFDGVTAQIGGIGLPTTLDTSTGVMCANVNTNNIVGEQILTFNVNMDYVDHIDNYEIQMTLGVIGNEFEIMGSVQQGGIEVDEICIGDGDVTVTYSSITGDIETLFGVNGVYSSNGIVSSGSGTAVISESVLSLNGENCIKIIKTDIDNGGPDCECVDIPWPSPTAGTTFNYYFARTCNGSFDRVIRTTWNLIIGNNGTDSTSISIFGTPYYPYNVATQAQYDANAGDFASVDVTNLSMQYGCTYQVPLQDCTNCDDDTPTLICNTNLPTITYDCDEDSKTITASTGGTLTSAVLSDVFESSTDGVNYSAFGGSVSNQTVLHLRRTIKFSDGCPDIIVSETVFCNNVELCENELEITYVLDPTLLTITQTENFTSPIQFDSKLLVSVDSGLTFNEYTAPIVLTGGEEIIMKRTVDFADNCNSINFIKTDVNEDDDNDTECAGYANYDLDVTFDEEALIYTVTKTGDEAELLTNELLWTLNNGNPFDSNKSGIPYVDPVNGEGVFIAAWKIKLENCEEKIIYKNIFGKACIKLCDPIELNLEDLNIEAPQVTVINNIDACCDENPPMCPSLILSIACVNRVLTLTGAPAGATITWSGNGLSGTGNPVTFESTTPSGTFTATVTDITSVPGETCTYTATYNYTKPNAGTPIAPPIIVE